MRQRRKRSKRRVSSKKIFILLMGMVIIFIFGITIFSGILKDNMIDVNAQTVKDNNKGQAFEEPEEPEKVVLDNSGYLQLEDDVNADDASVILPEVMHKWNF